MMTLQGLLTECAQWMYMTTETSGFSTEIKKVSLLFRNTHADLCSKVFLLYCNYSVNINYNDHYPV